MYIYNNTCGVNSECKYGYSLYFPCVKTLTRGENACFDFYIVDNATKEEVDLREVDDITLNVSGRYNCNFGSYSYPENIKSTQVERFSEKVYDIDFSDIINRVKLYIDIVDEKHIHIDTFLFDGDKNLDIAIDGAIGYFLKGSNKNGILNLKGFDTKSYIFLGWNIEESDEYCDNENIYDYLINNESLNYNIEEDCVIRAVYQKRRDFEIRVADDNYNSSFEIEYLGDKITLYRGESTTVLEGHDVKISCIPNDVKPFKFIKWDDDYKSPYRVLKADGDNLKISLKAYCELNGDNVEEYIDDIDSSTLNNFKVIYPEIRDIIFVDKYYINNMSIINCEVDILNDVPYVKINDGGYIQIKDIDIKGNFKLLLESIGGNCSFYIDDYEVPSSIVDRNEFVFEFDGGIFKITGDNSCIFGLNIGKEVIYDKGRCMLCLDSEDTLKLQPGELVTEGGVSVNGNLYGISPVKFASVTNITPLIVKNNNIIL